MNTTTLRRLARGTAALLAVALLCALPAGTTATDAAPGTTDDLGAWQSSGAAASWWAKARGNGKGKAKGKASSTSVSAANVNARGGQKSSSNPTTVPIVDTDFQFSMPATYDQLALAYAHRRTRGAGVTVAVLDGGFNTRHPDIATALVGSGYDAIDDDDDAHDTGNGIDDDGNGLVDDAAGHGTFVCGMIHFVAPEARILPIRVRDDEGWGTNAELERGLMMAWLMGADVINISGESAFGRSRTIGNMIEYFHRIGIVVVNSAGNRGYEHVSTVGEMEHTLIVGAVDREDRVALFSNTPEPGTPHFVMAPGVDLYGPLGIGGEDDSRGYYSGTSFSTAIVSGVAALVRAMHPAIDTETLMGRILWSADPLVDDYGRLLPYGRVNAARAVLR